MCFDCFVVQIRITSLAIWLRLRRAGFLDAICGNGDFADDRAGFCLDGRRSGRARGEHSPVRGFDSLEVSPKTHRRPVADT